jgi:hypothetical protein
LEKIFQIPYWVRPMESQASEKFIGSLVSESVRRERNAVARELARLDEESPATAMLEQPEPAPAPSFGPGHEAAGTATAHERPEPIVAPAPTPESVEAEARAMVLETPEREFMIRLAPFAGDSPRRGKRFVNAYRLVKAGLRPSVLATFVGPHGEAEDYRALLVQLAISTGAPLAAGTYFDALAREQNYAAVRTAIETTPGPDNIDRRYVLGALDIAERSGLSPAALARWSSLARRYSFVPHS